MKTIKEKIEISKRILPYVKNYRIQWVLLLVLKVGQKIPILLHPIILKKFIDEVIEKKNLSFMLIIIAMYIGVFLLETILKVGHRIIDNSLFNKITEELRSTVFYNYLNFPAEKYDTYQIGDLTRRLNFDIDMVKIFLIRQVFDYLSCLFIIFISFIFMFNLDWHMGIIAVVLMPISILLSEKFKNILEENAEKDRVILCDMEKMIEKIVSHWKEIKANQFESLHEEAFSNLLCRLLNCRNKSADLSFCRTMILDTKEMVVDLLGIYVFGGVFSLMYGITASTVIATVGYYENLLNSVRQILETDADLRGMKPAINRVLEVLEFVPENPKLLIKEKKEVAYEFNDLTYQYNNMSREVIRQMNCAIKAGEKVLVDGISGSGKSTLMKLMSGEIVSQNGEIQIYGVDINKISLKELYQHIRKIDHYTYFMNVSIREYLQMADSTVGFDDIKRVCIEVNLWDDINALPEGLEFTIGEDASNLSKGQKQKLALARLLLTKDKIIILDEAFSAIDVSDTVRILDVILKYFKNQTIICAAHDEEIKQRFSNIIEIGK